MYGFAVSGRKMYVNVLIDRVVESTERVIGEKQFSFGEHRSCSDQISAVNEIC